MSSLLALLKDKKQQLDSRNRAKTAKIPDGRSRWRILPSWRGGGDQQFWHDFASHYIKNAKGEMQAVYVCVDKTYGRPCEICDTVAHAIKHATDDATLELLTQAKANGRVLVNAIHLDGPKSGEVQILELAPTAFGMIVGIAAEYEEAGESIFDISAGKDLVIERSGAGKQTKYSVMPAAKTSPVPRDVMTKLHNLDDYVRQESAEQQTRALNAVRVAAGALPAPVGSSVATRAGAGGLPAGAVIVEDDYATAPPPKPKAAAPAPAAKAAAPAPAPAVEASTGDAELDDLMAQLDASAGG